MQRWTIIGLVLALIGPGAVALFAQAIATEPETLPPRALGLFLFIALTAAVIVIATQKENTRLIQLGFANSGWLSALWAVPLTLFFIYLYGPAIYAALLALNIGGFEGGLGTLHQLPTAYLIVAIAIVAAAEEWLYRGYAIERLEAITGSTWAAGALSLTAFVIVHLPLWGFAAALSTAVAGLIFTLLYIWRRDILMLIIAHVATDFVGIIGTLS
ncbi:MAG: CPBP family intramembrane glutamic endopeptidase [Alphaproteobacteria bacterium]